MIKLLLELIEEKRQKMILTAMNCGLTSKKTIRLSQELDKLLNLVNKPHQHNEAKAHGK